MPEILRFSLAPHDSDFASLSPFDTNAITSTAVTTTTDGQFIFGATADMALQCTTITAGTNFTLRNYSTCAGIPVQSESLIQAAAGSQAATFTVNSATDDWSTIIMTFKEAPVAILQQRGTGWMGVILQ